MISTHMVSLLFVACGTALSGEVPTIDDSPYAAFSYHFNVRHSGKQMQGHGEAYVDTSRYLFRLTGVSDPIIGETEITLIINGAKRTIVTYLNMKAQKESQCIVFPFPTIADETQRLTRLNEGTNSNIPWVRGREMQLTWFMKNVTHVSVTKGEKLLREYDIDSWKTQWEPDVVLDPPFLPKFDVDQNWRCIPSGDADDRLAHLGMRWPNRDSLALGDVVAAMSLKRPDLFMRAALALPSDLAISLESPNPPDFSDLGAISFKYKSVNFQAEDKSKGNLWIDVRQQLLKLEGKTKMATHGDVSVVVTVFGETKTLVSEVTLPDGATECLRYAYPKEPTGLLDALADLDEESVSFLGTVDLDEVETFHFVAPLLRKRLLHLYVDQETDRVWRVDIEFPTGQRIQTHLSEWDIYDKGLSITTFTTPVSCSNEEDSKTDDDISRLRLKSPHGKSLALVDALFALTFTNTHRQAVLFNAFALPGELQMMVDEPKPPTLAYSHLRFQYETITRLYGYPFKGHTTKLTSFGTFAFNAAAHELMLQGAITKMPTYGDVNATVIILSREGEDKKSAGHVYSRMTWTRPVKGNQCMITNIPEAPEDIEEQFEKQDREPVRFLKSENIRDVDCNLFRIKMPRGKLMVLAVPRDHPDRLVQLTLTTVRHPEKPRSIVYFTNWTASIPSTPYIHAAWDCRLREDIEEPMLSGPGLDDPHRKVRSLAESIFAMSERGERERQGLMLPILSLPAELDLMVRRPTSVDPQELQYLYTEFGGRTEGTGHFAGHFALNLMEKKLVVTASSSSLSVLGRMDLSLLVTGDSLYITAQFGEPIKAYCFAYSLDAFKGSSPVWSEVHFLGTDTARDDRNGLDAECHAFDINIPGSKNVRLRIFKAVDDNEILRFEIGKPGATPMVIVQPTVWRTHPRPDAELFNVPSDCKLRPHQDLGIVLYGDKTFPPILEAVSRARNSKTPPLYLLALPAEWPHFALHLHHVCMATSECITAEVPLSLTQALSRLPLAPGPAIVKLGALMNQYSFSFDSRSPTKQRGLGSISVNVPQQSLRIKMRSVGDVSPGVGQVESTVALDHHSLTVQSTLNGHRGPCMQYDLEDSDFGGGLASAKPMITAAVRPGQDYNFVKQLGRRQIQLAIVGGGLTLKLTSMALIDPHKPASTVTVDVTEFSTMSSDLANMTFPADCINGGDMPVAWDLIRIFL